MADWAKIKAEYIRDSSTSYRKLAKAYSVSMAALRKRAKTEEWVKLREQKEHKRDTRIVDACATKEAKKACRIIDESDVLLDILHQKVESGEVGDSLDNLMLAANILYRIKETRKGYTDTDIREQLARIKKLEREAEKDDGSNNIEFIIPDELRRFCK